MPKNKALILIGLLALLAFIIAGILWASSIGKIETPIDQNISSETEDESILEEDANGSDTDGTNTGNNSVLPAPVPPTTTTSPTTTVTPPLTTSAPPTLPIPPQAETVNVTISNFAYTPLEVRIKQGTTVVWINEDSAGHTVTSDSGMELDSVLFGKGETFSHTFNSKGEFSYFCKPHPWMKAKIIVE